MMFGFSEILCIKTSKDFFLTMIWRAISFENMNYLSSPVTAQFRSLNARKANLHRRRKGVKTEKSRE